MEKNGYRLNCILPNFTCYKQMYKKNLYIKNILLSWISMDFTLWSLSSKYQEI